MRKKIVSRKVHKNVGLILLLSTMPSSNSKPPAIAGTLQTDPRSGGLKRKSGVNVLPNVSGKGPFLGIRDVHFVQPRSLALNFKQFCRMGFLYLSVYLTSKASHSYNSLFLFCFRFFPNCYRGLE